MRAVAVFLVVFASLTAVGCGSKSGPNKEPAVVTESFPAVACSTLTEAEVGQFVKALPAFKAALRAAKWMPTPLERGGGPVAALSALVEGLSVAGVEESLKTAGTDWRTFRSTMYKVFAASAGLSVGSMSPEQVGQLKQDTTENGKRVYTSYMSIKGACSVIPPANLEVVKAHQQELEGLGTLGQ